MVSIGFYFWVVYSLMEGIGERVMILLRKISVKYGFWGKNIYY